MENSGERGMYALEAVRVTARVHILVQAALGGERVLRWVGVLGFGMETGLG